MDRRDFMRTTGVGLAATAIPRISFAADEIEQRIAEILPQLSLDEKISLMNGVLGETVKQALAAGLQPEQGHGYTGRTIGIERLGVPPIKCLDGPRGVGFRYQTSCFPVGIARAATFDPALEEKVGAVMGYETRALGANMLLAPCINLLWHPRWGRAQESYGEDMLVLGEMGAAFTKGVQQHAMACPKHYAVNNIEDRRTEMDAIVDERTLREIFLPHFRKCAEARAASIMSSYNHLNGPKAGENQHLVREILKNEWGWDGFVVSDWGGAMEDAALAGNAGLDLEMPQAKVYGEKLKAAVESGKVPVSAIDDAVARMIRQTLRFSGPKFEKGYSQDKIAGKEHAAVALEVARKSAVLLKNDGVLPFSGIKTLAVLGKRAKDPNLGDRGSSTVTPPYSVSILDALQKRPGLKVTCSGGSLVKARALAAKADATVVVVGLNWIDEGEGHDRKRMGISPSQVALVKAAAAAGKKCAVVLIGGSAITMEEWLDKVPALLLAWYPGMEGGNAVSEILFGEVNPSGKLPVVFPQTEDQLAKFDSRALRVEYKGFHGYRYMESKGLEPLFPFGFGLSYTKFKYANLSLSKKTMGKSGQIQVSVDLTNIGKVPGEEVAQLYVGPKGSKVDRPIKELKGFARIALEPGQTRTVSFDLNAKDLAYFNAAKSAWEVEEIDYTVFAGPSSRKDDLLSDSFKVSGA